MTAGEALAIIEAGKKLKLEQKATTQKSQSTKDRVLGKGVPDGAPNVRTGEDPMTSRGYSFARVLGMVSKAIDPKLCSVELDVSNRLKESMANASGFHAVSGAVMAPLCPAYLMGDRGAIVSNEFGYELKSLMWSGQGVHDPEAQAWLIKKHLGGDGASLTQKGYDPDTAKNTQQPLSWLQQGIGGAIVDYPSMGPLIPLLRNRNALMTAGAEVIPLGPSGRMAWPRETSPASYQWVGENKQGDESQIGTDQFLLQAKKIMSLVKLPNELIRFGGPAAEQIARNSMTQSISLGLDYTLLHSDGNANVPTGLVSYPGVQTFTPTTGISGNTGAILAPGDINTFVGQIEETNAGIIGGFGGWIMRPALKQKFLAARSGVYNGSGVTPVGPFLFDILRDFNPDSKQVDTYLNGYRVYDTPNVASNRTAGTATNKTIMFGGVWSDYKIGMYGVLEFVSTDQGYQLVSTDQTLIRAIMSADGGPWHPGVFGYADSLEYQLSA